MKFWRKMRDTTRGVADSVIPRPGGDPGGVPARGVVVEVINVPWGNSANDSYSLWTSVTVSLRRSDAPDSPPTIVNVYLKSRGWRAIAAGQDVPIRVDPSTGAVLNLDGDAYETAVDAGAYAPPDFTPDFEPEAGSLDAIEGVTLEVFATTLARITRDMVPPAEQDAFAASRGVPAGRWTSVCVAWQERSQADWKVGARFGELFQAEMQRP